MPHLYMLIGTACTGKSTWATQWRKDFPSVWLDTDTWLINYAQISNISYSEALKYHYREAEDRLLDMAKYAISDRVDVIWDQTNLTIKSRRWKLEMFKDYVKHAITFTPPKKTKEAWLTRRNRGLKVIPWSIIEEQEARYQPPTTGEGFHFITAQE